MLPPKEWMAELGLKSGIIIHSFSRHLLSTYYVPGTDSWSRALVIPLNFSGIKVRLVMVSNITS